MLGVMSSAQALELAHERGLDLVEVSPMAVPPVCKLMDYGRFKYEQSKKENEARKHQKTTELKEIRMRPRTDEHDLAVKVRKIEEFLADGDKVKVGVIFRGREMAHPELGRQLLERVIVELKNAAVVERLPSMEGKMVSLIVSRAPGWEPAKKTAPVTRERKGTKADTAVDATTDATDAAKAPEGTPAADAVIAQEGTPPSVADAGVTPPDARQEAAPTAP